jgi:hypothetical protein
MGLAGEDGKPPAGRAAAAWALLQRNGRLGPP